jgi:hypothetical protein
MAFPLDAHLPGMPAVEDSLGKYVNGGGPPPELEPNDNPQLYETAVGINCFGNPVSGRFRINQVIQWCLERDPNDRPRISRLILHVKSIVWN